MKLKPIVILVIMTAILSCTKEEGRKTSTLIYRANGTGKVDFITYALDCYPEGQLGCATEEVMENQELPFEVQVDELFTDLIFMRIYVDEEFEKNNLHSMEIIINGESHLLQQEDFWWTEWNGSIRLEHSVSN